MRKVDRVYIQQWLEHKPYDNPSGYDRYYLKLCNELNDVLQSKKHANLRSLINEGERHDLCCILVSYFEDIVSGIGIWNAFITGHKKLYGSYLPFYNPNEGDYFTDDINPEDTCFLTWYALSLFYKDEKFFDPLSKEIIDFGNRAYKIFDREFEVAEETDFYKEFFYVNSEEEDYYDIRYRIEWLMLFSYLFFADIGFKLEKQLIDLIETEREDDGLGGNFIQYERSLKDNILINTPTALLNYRSKDWLAEIVGKKHPLYADIKDISKKISGHFLYKGYDDKNVFFTDITTDKEFKVTRDSFDILPELTPDETILYIGFVKWKGEWWFSGIMAMFDYNADLVLDSKNSIQDRLRMETDLEKIDPLIEIQYEKFLDFNNGLPIAFLDSTGEANKFLEDYILFYINSLELSEEEKGQASKRAKAKGVLNPKKEIDMPDLDLPTIVFFNQKSGIEISTGIHPNVLGGGNLFSSEQETKAIFIELVLSSNYSAALVNYLVKHYYIKSPSFDKRFIKDLDFMMRFWKQENYEPKISTAAI